MNGPISARRAGNRRRRRLLLAGVLPTVVALAFAGGVVRMSLLQADGLASFDAGDHPAAATAFGAAGRWNPVEDWISAFDEGAARHADGQLTGAIDLYRAALEDVPNEEECTVRINLALAHEAVGNAAAATEPDNAVEAWRAGLRVLREGGCPTDAGQGERQTQDAQAVEERLAGKIRGSDDEEREDADPEQGKKAEREERRRQREEEQRQRELEERNEQGRSQREEGRRERESGGSRPQW